jgi:acyl-CoA thioesterase FadM
MVAALIDEACGLVATWYRFPTVTGRMFLRYRRPVPINRPLSVRAWVEEERGRRVFVRGELWESDDLLAEARLAFVHVRLEHFLETPEGRAHAEAWRARLEADPPA